MLFHRDKMKGTLKLKEGRALAWAVGSLKLAVYTVEWDEGKSAASVVFVSTKASKKLKHTDNGPVFTVNLKGKASVIYLRDPKIGMQRNSVKLSLRSLKKKSLIILPKPFVILKNQVLMFCNSACYWNGMIQSNGSSLVRGGRIIMPMRLILR